MQYMLSFLVLLQHNVKENENNEENDAAQWKDCYTSENRTWRKMFSSFSQTNRYGLFVAHLYDLKWFVSVFLSRTSPELP